MNRVELERQYWDKEAKAKDVARRMHDPWLSTDEEVKIIIEAMPKDAKRVLEIGCGTGRLLERIAKKYPKAIIEGLDISEKLLDIAFRKKLPRNVFLRLGKGREFPPESHYLAYGFIYSVTVFQHIDQEGIESYFSEVGKVLRKGGIFLFQFIEGSEHEPMSHHYSFGFIHQLLLKSNMFVLNWDVGLIHKKWTWITARKV